MKPNLIDKSAKQVEFTESSTSTVSAEVVEQINSCNEQAWSFRRTDSRRALELSMEARCLAKAYSYDRGLAYSLQNCSECNYRLGNYTDGLPEALQALALFQRLEDRTGEATAWNLLGRFYESLGEYSKAIESCMESRRIFEGLDNRLETSKPLNVLGGIYFQLGDYAKALDCFQQSITIKTESTANTDLSPNLCNIGVVYEQLGQYEKALEYYDEAYRTSQESGDTEGQSVTLTNLGMVYRLLGNYPRALEYLLSAADVSQTNRHKYPEATVFIYLGKLFQIMGEDEKALDSCQKGLEIARQIGHKLLEAEGLICLGELFLAQNAFAQSAEILSEALVIAEAIQNVERISKAHYSLSQVYEKQGDYSRALSHYKAYEEARQKLFGETADKNLQRVMIQAEVEKTQKEAEIHRLKHVELAARVRELEEITLKLKVSQEKVLKLEKQATEQQMAGGFAHEMRNALAGSKLILDQALALDGQEPNVSLNLANCRNLKEIYLELKDKLPEQDAQVVLGKMQTIFANEERLDEVMQLVRKATSRGLNITQQIMDYSKISQHQPGQQTVDLHSLIVSIVDESREEFSSQGVVIEYKSEHQLLTLIGDETHFYSILKNIVLNARDALIDPSLKDRKDRRIEITATLEVKTCRVVIADNGVGIAKENLQQVFEPFFSTKPATGTGLGLGMVMKLASLYNGKIEISSEVGKGTSVTITLPVSQQGESL